jgi:hypothetical protein
MAIVQNCVFYNGRMEKDAAEELFPEGVYRDAINLRPVDIETGSVGTLTNETGNEQVEYTFTQLGSDPFIRVIGSKLDLKRRRVYWLVYGQNNGSDQYAYVLYYSYETGDITTVFSHENILDFNPDFTISDIDIVYDDELGDTLYWTDRNSEPKKLNVTAGVNRFNSYTVDTSGFAAGDIVFADTEGNINGTRLFIPCRALTTTNDFPSYSYTTGELDTTDWETLPVGQCYPPFLTETMFYQKPITPYWSPNSTYFYDTGSEDVEGVATFLRRRSYQFAYSYVYFDGEESEFSPFSEAVFSDELTAGIYTAGEVTADPDFPTPVSISVRVPIHTFRYTDEEDVESVVEAPHSMIARVKLYIREVPTTKTPTDWNQWEDIPYDELYKYNLSSAGMGTGFPVAGTAGTYYYDWYTSSYSQAPSGQTSQLTTITVAFDGTQTLIPVDKKLASTNFFIAPKKSNTQTIIDNRLVHGGVTDGMNVSRDVIQSIEDNISITRTTQNPIIITSSESTTLNKYNSSTTTQSYNPVTDLYTGVFDLESALVIGDFDTFFSVSFTFEFKVIVSGNVVSTTPFTVQGSSNGIPDDDATFEEFVEGLVNSQTPFTASVNNTTGELTITRTIAATNATAYDTDIINNSGFVTLQTYRPYRTFKNHSAQQFGVTLQDDAGRQTELITGEWATIDFGHFISDDGNFDTQTFLARIGGLADIEVPTEARVLNILRKRSPSYQNYIQFCLSEGNSFVGNWDYNSQFEIGYVNLSIDEPNPDPSSNNKNLYISLSSVNGGDGRAYELAFDTSVLGFLPTSGDVLRFLYKMDNGGAIDEIYNATFNIEKYDERTNTIVVNFEDIEDNEPTLATYLESVASDPQNVRVLCEVIQKPSVSDQELYWEVAAQLSCTDGAVDINSDRDRINIFGDAYLKLRGYCTDANPEAASGENYTFQNFILQDPNYNDFTPSNNYGEGRPSLQVRSLRRGSNEYVETTRDNLLRYSEQSIQNTDVRRFGRFYGENIQEVDNIYGRIENIDGEGDKLGIYQEDKISMVYVGRGITTELSGGQRVIASQNNVFSDVVYNPFEGGISIDGDSFAKSGYQRYFTDSKRGMVYRQSMDGVTPISEVGMSGEFKNIFRKLRNSFTTPIIRGIVDERTDEYILSITYSEESNVTVFNASPLSFSFMPPDNGVTFTAFADDQRVLIDTSPIGKFNPQEFTMFGNQQEDGTVTVSQKPDGSNPEDGDVVRVNYPVNVTLVYSERTKGWTSYLSYTAEWLEAGIQSYHTFLNGEMWLHDIGNTDYCTFFGQEQEASVTVVGNPNPTQIKDWLVMRVKANTEDISAEITTQLEQSSSIPNGAWRKYEGEMRAPFYRDTNLQSGARLKGRWVQSKVTFSGYDVNDKKVKCFSIAMKANESPETF